MKGNIYLILAALLILISLIMAIFNWKTNKNILFLSLFVAILGVEGMMSWYFYTDHSNVKIFAVFLNHFAPLYTLKAPLLYFFVRNNIRDDHRLSITDFFHFLPALLHLILIIPYILLPFSEKVDIAVFIKENLHLYLSADLRYPYPHIWNQYFRSLQLIVYSLISMVLIFRFRKIAIGIPQQLKDVYRFSGVWMMILLAAFFMAGLMQFVMVIQPAATGDSMQGLQNAERLFRFALILYIIIPSILLANPRFMYGFPSFRVDAGHHNPGLFVIGETTLTPPGTDFSSHVFDNLDLLYDEMKKQVESNSLFLDSELKITNIGERMKVAPHLLVLCLSIKHKKSFADFLNEYRVKYVIQLVKNHPECQSAESFAEKCGFNSITDFQAAFQKFTGLSFKAWYTMTITKT